MRARATATDHVTRLSSHLASNCPLPDIQQLPSCASLCWVLIVIALMWQEMSSRAEILARAREKKKELKEKKPEGPWGGCVLARVERCKKRHSIALHAMALPVEVIQLVCMLAAQPSMQAAYAACVCQAWCNALRGMHVFSCMYLVQRHLAPSDAVSMSATCQSFARMFARARTRMIARAKRIEMKHMVNNWMDVRVGVPWERDGSGTVYHGTVIGVRSGGRCLRVELDEGAGKMRLRSHTIPVDEVFVLQ